MDKPGEVTQVALIANYPPDRQWSMKRFADLLSEGLEARNVSVTILHPPVVFGKLGATSHGIGKWLGYIDKYLLAPCYLKRRIKALPRPRVVHICDHSNAFYTGILQKEAHLVTCHDMLAIRSALGEFEQNRVGFTGRIQQWHILRGLKRARRVVCVSKATASDLSRLTDLDEARIAFIPNCLSPEFTNITDSAHSSDRAEEEAPYLLHVGSAAWYKNRGAVLSIFKLMAKKRPELSLKIVGPEFSTDVLERSGATDLAEKIHYPDCPGDKELQEVYADADLLLFPSLIEGFGWPILEAQACGTPVLTSQTQPMSELNALPRLSIKGDPSSASWHQEAAEACLAIMATNRAGENEIENKLRTFCRDYTVDLMAAAYIELHTQLLTEETV